MDRVFWTTLFMPLGVLLFRTAAIPLVLAFQRWMPPGRVKTFLVRERRPLLG
jgi:hypothetical protein